VLSFAAADPEGLKDHALGTSRRNAQGSHVMTVSTLREHCAPPKAAVSKRESGRRRFYMPSTQSGFRSFELRTTLAPTGGKRREGNLWHPLRFPRFERRIDSRRRKRFWSSLRMRTSGWRRLAVVLCGAWCIGIFSVAGYELITRRVGYFIELTLPVGTVISGNKAILPDGRVVELQTTIDVRSLKPGEIKWVGEPGVVELQLRSVLLAVTLVVPMGLWAGFEVIAVVGGWILRGFRGTSR